MLADASVDHLQEIVDAARLRMMDPTPGPIRPDWQQPVTGTA